MFLFGFTTAAPENGTWLTYDCTTPNWYIDFEDVPFGTHLDVYCTNDGFVTKYYINQITLYNFR